MEKISNGLFQKNALSETEKHFIKGGEAGKTTVYTTTSENSTWLFWTDTSSTNDEKYDNTVLPAGNNVGTK